MSVTIRTLHTRYDALLENPMTVALMALLKDKTEAGMEAFYFDSYQTVQRLHAEAFGAYELWLNVNRDDVSSLDDLSKSRLDNWLFKDLKHLDEALDFMGDK
ncbi:hypothetical protein NX722_05755 [Endozoicomonas gorgoniicola]|uniref:Uncharacterized protein n=1 Tax=Endozoicomonas gorgoniicola TaxID=1234144 RepID=A0ABT3MS17_9GAMM|nr:hypothetical protein [Endozoicomonas gorgoniicola]MCW7552158.1 hypothetical protein [Endozoicomonas gorgoniicola]